MRKKPLYYRSKIIDSVIKKIFSREIMKLNDNIVKT